MRQIAVPVYIGELLQGQYEEKEGWDPNVLHCARGAVSRCNIIGTVLQIPAGLVLDDGTGQAPLRAFDDVPGMSQVQAGQIVQCIGRPRMYNEELVMIAELIRPIDVLWAKVRKQELGELKPYIKQELAKPVEQAPKEPENNAEKIITIIAKLDAGEGADVDAVISQSGLDIAAEDIINQLLREGDIFEIRPGMIKVLQ